jgi:lipopolysaccharide export system permease protein
MLKTLDKYILKKYLGTFFFIVLMFSMLALVIDFAEKVEDFVGPKAPTWGQIFGDYYLNFIPFINSLLFPLYTLITVIFFTSRLAGNSEIIGMLGNGVNFYRILVPYLVGALVITTLHFLGNHYVFPQASKTRVAFENTYIWKNNFNSPTENIHFMLDEKTEVYIQVFSRSDSIGRNVWLMRYDSTGISRPHTIIAKSLKAMGGNRWQFKDYRIRTVNGMEETLVRNSLLDTTLAFSVSDLVRRDNYHQAMTTDELIAYIDKERERGMTNPIIYEVERYRRSADPFTNIILTIIGLSIASRKTRGGMGWHLVIGLLISGVFIFMTKFSTTFATNAGFTPVVAMWIPNILFSFVAVFMLIKAQK